MADSIPFVVVPAKLAKSVGKPGSRTRRYEMVGGHPELQTWLSILGEQFVGDLLPLNWCPEYVGVTRAAIHKRIKAGNLTAFVFCLVGKPFTVFGAKYAITRQEFAYVLRSECDAWQKQLLERRDRRAEEEDDDL